MKKRTLRAPPVSSREDKIKFIKRHRARIQAAQESPQKAVEMLTTLANKMLAAGLYLKSTALTDRRRTIYLIVTELGYWPDGRINAEVIKLI